MKSHMKTSYHKLRLREELSSLLIRKMDSEWFACETHKFSSMMEIRKSIVNEFLTQWCRSHNYSTMEEELIKRQKRMDEKVEEKVY